MSVVLTAIRLIVLLLVNLFISISDSESCFYSCCFASIYNDYISYVKNLEKKLIWLVYVCECVCMHTFLVKSCAFAAASHTKLAPIELIDINS